MDSTGVRLVLERPRALASRTPTACVLRRGSAAVQRVFELSGVAEDAAVRRLTPPRAAHRDDRRVVGLRADLKGRPAHRRGTREQLLRRSSSRRAREQLAQPRLAEALSLAARVGDAVGVEQRSSRRARSPARGRCHSYGPATARAGAPAARSRGPFRRRRRAAASGDPAELRTTPSGVRPSAERRAQRQRAALLSAQGPGAARIAAGPCVGLADEARPVTHQRRQRRRLDALAGDVADDRRASPRGSR